MEEGEENRKFITQLFILFIYFILPTRSDEWKHKSQKAVRQQKESLKLEKSWRCRKKLYFTHLQSFAVDLTNCNSAVAKKSDALMHRSVLILFDVGNDAVGAGHASALTMDFLTQ